MSPRATLLLLIHALLALPVAGQTSPESGTGARPELFVSSGFAESKRISSEVEAFPIWISFENRSAGEIRGLRFVDFRKGGLALAKDDPCWRPIQTTDPESPKFPSCVLDSNKPTEPSNLPDRLEPGQAVTVTGSLQRSPKSGEFMVTGVYAWIDPNGREHRGLVPIGPIEVTKKWESWDDWKERYKEDFPIIAKDMVIPFLKDLAWPVVFFFLGILFKAGEERRTAAQGTWSQMLPVIHGHTTEYYLPISTAAAGLLSSLEQNAVKDVDEDFYNMALLFRRMRATMHDIGGFYLKDRGGEDLVLACWALIFDEFTGYFPAGTGIASKEILVDSIGPKETLREYKKKLSPSLSFGAPYPGRSELTRIQRTFKDWTLTKDFDELVRPLLQVFNIAIDFEINRPYDTWYTRPDSFDAACLLKQERKLRSWARKAREDNASLDDAQKERIKRVEDFAQELRRYRRDNAARSKPWGTRWMVRRWYDLRSLASA